METVNGELNLTTSNDYLMCTVIDGNLSVENIDLYLSQCFIIPVNSSAKVTGNGKLFITKSKI